MRLFAELHGDPAVSAARSFVINVCLSVVVVALVMVIFQMLPLKTTVPYIVEATPSGVVGRVIAATRYEPTDAMIKAELGKWVEQVMLIDPHRTRDNLRRSTAMLRGKAVAEHKALLDTDQVFRRMLETPGLVRTVRVTGADTSSQGIAFIFATTTERTNSGTPLVQKWRFTLHYAMATPESEEEILSNPLGLHLTHIERSQDNS